MGMSCKEYDNITYKDLMLKIKGHKMRQREREKHLRTIAFSAYISPHVPYKSLIKDVEKFWPITDEDAKKADRKKITEAKRTAIREALKKEFATQK